MWREAECWSSQTLEGISLPRSTTWVWFPVRCTPPPILQCLCVLASDFDGSWQKCQVCLDSERMWIFARVRPLNYGEMLKRGRLESRASGHTPPNITRQVFSLLVVKYLIVSSEKRDGDKHIWGRCKNIHVSVNKSGMFSNSGPHPFPVW